MESSALTLENKIKNIKKSYNNKAINGQQVIDKIHSLKKDGLSIGMNIDNYLYRNGIFNKRTAVLAINRNVGKYHMFPDRVEKFRKEFNAVQNSKQNWFENYGIHNSSYHDLIKLQLDNYKVIGLLNSLFCDLYVGTYNEGSAKDLMKE